jgi:hypothetical protein
VPAKAGIQQSPVLTSLEKPRRIRRSLSSSGPSADPLADDDSIEPQFPFSLAFAFGCDLFQIESQIAKVNRRTPGKRLWIEFSTSQSLGAALTAAVSRATRPAGEIPFFYVK